MKIYRPMVTAETNKAVMVEEEPDMVNDTSDRCVMLDDLKDKLKLLKSKVTHTYSCERQLKESEICRCDYHERIKLIDQAFNFPIIKKRGRK